VTQGGAAEGEIRSFRPDVVLLDIGLPDVDGYTLARRFRKNPDMSSLRLVALSGYARAEDIDRALHAGFDRHIAKPANPGELLALIREASHAD